MITDAHLHLSELFSVHEESLNFIEKNDYTALVSCHSIKDLEFAEKYKNKLFVSFGAHPQNPDPENVKTLKKLIDEKRIDAIGEIGFDRYSDEFKNNFDKQVEVFEIQLNIAAENKLPVVLHIRKAFEEIFKYSKTLSMLPAVIFHSYSGTSEQADFLLKKGINCFFSFGTSILNGHKKTVAALRSIPIGNILVETDAPYQPLKGEHFSKPEDIMNVLGKTAEIKGVDLAEIVSATSANFQKTLTKK